MSGLSLGTHPSNLKFVPLAVLELLALNAPKFMGSRDRDHTHFSEIFVRYMSGLSLRTRLPNLKFVPSAVLHVLAFNAQKFMGSRDPGHAHISETFVRGHVGTISITCLSNLKFVPLAILDLLADRHTHTTDRNRPIRNDSVVNGYCWTLDTGHWTPCTSDFIFCPMLLCSALDRQ